MQRTVKFADYQEQTAGDHNNLQAFAREAIDDLVKDFGTPSKGYAGLTVSKTGQVEITVAPGRIYDGGAGYARRSSLTQSMATYTAAAARKLVVVSAFGQVNDTATEVRDYLIDVANRITEPRAVPTQAARDVQIVFTAGAEAADPVPPAIPATHVVIAHVLMDTTQVLSVTMIDGNKVANSADLDQRADALEAFRKLIEPRVSSLASDLADLANRAAALNTKEAFQRVQLDVARLKEALRFPANAVGYGADFYLKTDKSDTANASALGYDAKVMEGIRFADANANEFEISLFSANDPNASNNGGLLLPKFTDVLKIGSGAFASELGIAQYGFQVFNTKQGFMSRSRLRYGGSLTVCTNGMYYNTPGQPNDAQNLYEAGSQGFTVLGAQYVDYASGFNVHEVSRTDTWWLDQWKEPFMYVETTDRVVSGAQVAQSFLVSNDMIATKLGFYITQKGGNSDVHLALCEVVNGQPNIERLVHYQVYPHASITVGWNRPTITPTFLRKGKRYALVLISNADHKIGMQAATSIGTFFYSTDGIYFLGDLTKDMMFEVWGARFNAAQVAIEFAPINLDGGFRHVDILAEQWAPESCKLVWQVRPNGTGEWETLAPDNGAVLAAAPPLAQFRAMFVGTADIQPMLKMTGSRVRVSRPKTAAKHISTPITVPALANTANNVTAKVIVEGYDESVGGNPHEHDLRLYIGSTPYTPVTETKATLDAAAKRVQITYTFSLPAGTTAFREVQDLATTSPQQTFHVAEMAYTTL
jgi:hypothetical protein